MYYIFLFLWFIYLFNQIFKKHICFFVMYEQLKFSIMGHGLSLQTKWFPQITFKCEGCLVSSNLTGARSRL